MTLAQFLNRLRRTPRHWVFSGSIIRLDTTHSGGKPWSVAACPITSLAKNGAVGADKWREVSTKLGLSQELAVEIMLAADGMEIPNKLRQPRINRLRALLLDACGAFD